MPVMNIDEDARLTVNVRAEHPLAFDDIAEILACEIAVHGYAAALPDEAEGRRVLRRWLVARAAGRKVAVTPSAHDVELGRQIAARLFGRHFGIDLDGKPIVQTGPTQPLPAT